MKKSSAFGVLLFSTVLLMAQLGPKDGLNLSPTDLNRVQVGDKAPDFTLRSAEGSNLSLSGFRGKTVVLVFYRGYW